MELIARYFGENKEKLICKNCEFLYSENHKLSEEYYSLRYYCFLLNEDIYNLSSFLKGCHLNNKKIIDYFNKKFNN